MRLLPFSTRLALNVSRRTVMNRPFSAMGKEPRKECGDLNESVTPMEANSPLSMGEVASPPKKGNFREISPEVNNELEVSKLALYRLIRQSSSSRDMDAIEKMVADMLTKFPPCMHLYNILLYARIMLNHTKGMSHIFHLIEEQGFRFNAITYNHLISYYRNSNSPEEAEAILLQMEENRCKPTRVTYTTLISAFAKKDIDKAKKYFDMMCSSSLKDVRPDQFSYNTMIGAYAVNGKFSEADSLVKEMNQKGIKPDYITYKIIIEALLKNKRTQDAWKIYSVLLTDSPEMKKEDYVELLLAFQKAMCHKESMHIFDELERRYGRVSPSVVVPVISQCIKAGDIPRIKSLLFKQVTGREKVYQWALPRLRTACQEANLDESIIVEHIERQ